jgi:hypothetical protein
MKKAILLIAALLLVGTMLFADASFGIWGRTRFNIAMGNQSTAIDDTWQSWRLWGNDGPQMQFNYSWSNDKLGYTFKIVTNGGGLGTGYDLWGSNGICKAYGTLKLLPALFTLHVGYMQDFDTFRYESGMQMWNTNSDNIGRFNGWGIIAVLAPKDTGFVLAAQFASELGNQNFIDINLNNISVAAQFQLPDIFKIDAGLVRSGGKGGGAEFYPNVSGERGAYHVFARVHLLAVQGMTLNITHNMWGLFENQAGWPYTEMRESLSFRMGIGAFAIAAAGDLLIRMPKAGGDTIMDLFAALEPSYNLGPITVGCGLGIGMNTTVGYDMPKFEIQPYVIITDFSTRIFFDMQIDNDYIAATEDYTWGLSADMTWSF